MPPEAAVQSGTANRVRSVRMMAACTSATLPSAGDQHAAAGSAARDVAKTLPHPRMEQRIEPLVAVGIGAARDLSCDRHCIAHVEHQRDIGNDPSSPVSAAIAPRSAPWP